jgi:hypothetical protein
MNLFTGRASEPVRPAESPARGSGNGEPAAKPRRIEKEYADPALHRN